ncbi:MAG: ATP-binding cassette domain-containing protein [Gammaproteobacteria bacterium]|nr:ATP-binding cassette domain-containing protein [Gammaproteobacteria bacterium]
MEKNVLLAAENLGLKRQGKTILSDVNLSLHESEIVTLIGPNGAGKTSLIRILLGLSEASEGKVYRRADLRIGYVPQRTTINPVLPLRVRDFLQLGARYSDDEIAQVLEEVGVSHITDSAIQNISGGELQRVLLGRALLKRPNVLVLDEPAQGVDIIGQQALYKMIAAIRDHHACGVLMVSHDLHLVMAATDQVICLNTHVCCTGHPDHISEHPEYLKLFGDALDGMAVYSHVHDHEHELDGAIVCTHHEDCSHRHG